MGYTYKEIIHEAKEAGLFNEKKAYEILCDMSEGIEEMALTNKEEAWALQRSVCHLAGSSDVPQGQQDRHGSTRPALVARTGQAGVYGRGFKEQSSLRIQLLGFLRHNPHDVARQYLHVPHLVARSRRRSPYPESSRIGSKLSYRRRRRKRQNLDALRFHVPVKLFQFHDNDCRLAYLRSMVKAQGGNAGLLLFVPSPPSAPPIFTERN